MGGRATDRPSTPQQERPTALLLLSGYLLALDACYLVATSRWGSYVGVPHRQIYIGDVLFGAAIVCWLTGGGVPRLWRTARRNPVVWIVSALLVWTLLRLATGHVDATALRDAAPYVYLLAVPIAMTAPISRRVLLGFLATALAVHAVWVAVAQLEPAWVARLPQLGRTSIFAVRSDFDELVLGLAIASGLLGAITARRWGFRAAWLVLAALGAWDLTGLDSRAGLLAAFACLIGAAIAIVGEQARRGVPVRRRLVLGGAGLTLCAGAAAGMLQSSAVHRLDNAFYKPPAPTPTAQVPSTPSGSPTARVPSTPSGSPTGAASVGPSSGHPTPKQSGPPASGGRPGGTPATRSAPTPGASPSPDAAHKRAADAAGTVESRKAAWKDVYRYTTRTAGRAVIGVGFGPDFLKASGAQRLLSNGESGLRAPHDILLNTWARLGAIGLVLEGILLALGAWLAVAVLVDPTRGPDRIVALLALGIPVVALLGVILESPFGALPYAFALGRLAAPHRGADPYGCVPASDAADEGP